MFRPTALPKVPKNQNHEPLGLGEAERENCSEEIQDEGFGVRDLVKRVEQAFHDIAKKSGKTLTAAELKELMYGEKGLIKEAHEYAKVHAGK